MSSDFDRLQPKLREASPRRNSSTKKKRPQSQKRPVRRQTPANDMSVEDYVEALVKQQKYSQSRSQYGRASKCKRQLRSLKSNIQNRNMKILKKQFKEEESKIARAREEEMNEMDQVWAQIADAYQKKCNQMIQAWEEKKQSDNQRLKEALYYLQENGGRSFSKDLVSLKMTQERLAKKQLYQDAKKVHESVKKLQKDLANRTWEQAVTKSNNLQSQLNIQQQKDYSALMKRILSGRQQQQMMYQKQQKKLQLKFDNILAHHRRQQTTELERIDRYNRTQNVLNLSRLDASWIVNNSQV